MAITLIAQLWIHRKYKLKVNTYVDALLNIYITYEN